MCVLGKLQVSQVASCPPLACVLPKQQENNFIYNQFPLCSHELQSAFAAFQKNKIGETGANIGKSSLKHSLNFRFVFDDASIGRKVA